MLSLRYSLFGFYNDCALTKKSPKKLCSVNTMPFMFIHALMLLWFTVSIMLIWGNTVTLLRYFHADTYFQRSCYFVEFHKSYDILDLWQARKHNIHPLNRDNTIWIYLINTSPVSSLFVNEINELSSSPLLQEHRQRNEEVSGKKNYSSTNVNASFVLTPLFI